MQPASLGGVLDRARGFLGDLQLRHLRREDCVVRRYVLAATGTSYRNGVGIFLSSYFSTRFDHQRAVGLDVDNPALDTCDQCVRCRRRAAAIEAACAFSTKLGDAIGKLGGYEELPIADLDVDKLAHARVDVAVAFGGAIGTAGISHLLANNHRDQIVLKELARCGLGCGYQRCGWLDLGVRLGLGPRTIGAASHNVILKNDVVGLLVDSIGDVVQAEEDEVELPPANAGRIDGAFMDGVIKLKHELLVVLSTKKILKHGSSQERAGGQ